MSYCSAPVGRFCSLSCREGLPDRFREGSDDSDAGPSSLFLLGVGATASSLGVRMMRSPE